MGLERFTDCPCDGEKEMLLKMVYYTTLRPDERETLYNEIKACDNYAHYQRLHYILENNQQSIHEIINPNGKDVNRHLKKFLF